MTKKRSYDKYLKNIATNNAINIGNATGIMIAGKLGSEVPAAGAGAMNNVYGAFGVSSQLGTINATFGKGGVLDAVGSLGKTSSYKKKRR